jgi:sterol desaturase/sphingolipid hydroxylase (fatty acid hydroxylase superfamily)
VAVAGCVAIQLLVQHANVDYISGPLERWLAINAGHRLHHLRYPGQGDVNFGLFTLLWDRAMGTYTPADTRAVVTSDDLGIAGRPDYPTTLTGQLADPFRPFTAMQAN